MYVICIKHLFHQWGQVRKMLAFSFVTPFHHWLIYAASDGTAWNWTIENRFLETKPLSGKKPLVCFQWTMSSKCTIDYKNVPYLKLVFELFVIELFSICFCFFTKGNWITRVYKGSWLETFFTIYLTVAKRYTIDGHRKDIEKVSIIQRVADLRVLLAGFLSTRDVLLKMYENTADL